MAEQSEEKERMKQEIVKVINFVNEDSPSYRALMCFADGQDRMCGGIRRPGFKIRDGLCKKDCRIIFSMVPIGATVNRSFHSELNGAIKCVVTLLKPWQYLIISGIIGEDESPLPNYIISFDGKNVELQAQKKFDFENFKRNSDEFFKQRAKTGKEPQIEELLSVVREAEREQFKNKKKHHPEGISV